jgi:rRNA maturation RNase YbeY
MIELINYTKFSFADTKRLKRWVVSSVKKEGFLVDNISFFIITDNELSKINKEFLSHTTLTDIITFNYSKEKALLCEIYISSERVLENAKIFSVTPEKEMLRVMIHGILHCCGYNDKSVGQKSTMTKQENFYISRY